MKKQFIQTLLLMTFPVGDMNFARTAGKDAMTSFKVHDGFGVSEEENKNPAYRIFVLSGPTVYQWPGFPT
jgi:hypothetical protein